MRHMLLMVFKNGSVRVFYTHSVYEYKDYYLVAESGSFTRYYKKYLQNIIWEGNYGNHRVRR